MLRRAPTPSPRTRSPRRTAGSTRCCPGRDRSRERLIAWREAQAVPPDKLDAAIDSLAEDFRERTERMFGLPDGEHIDFELVTNEPWAGSTTTWAVCAAGSRSTPICPCCRPSLGHLVAHEAYPGHHTEHSRKEVGLVRRRRPARRDDLPRRDAAVPAGRGARGPRPRGDRPGDRHETVAEHLRPLGIPYDAGDRDHGPGSRRGCWATRCGATSRSRCTTRARRRRRRRLRRAFGLLPQNRAREDASSSDRPDVAGLHLLLHRRPPPVPPLRRRPTRTASPASSPSPSSPRISPAASPPTRRTSGLVTAPLDGPVQTRSSIGQRSGRRGSTTASWRSGGSPCLSHGSPQRAARRLAVVGEHGSASRGAGRPRPRR